MEGKSSKAPRSTLQELAELGRTNDVDVRVSLIQALIPVGLEKVNVLLQDEVKRLAGEPRKHGKINTRWGSQGGSLYLLDQKVPVSVPRVRNKLLNTEVTLETYQRLQEPHRFDEQLFLKLLNGLSTHKYRESAELAPEVFGISASSVSKRFRNCGKAFLEKLLTRRLDEDDFVALFLDGKTYAKDGIVVALGITVEGRKVIVGIEQMSTENARAVGQLFTNELSFSSTNCIESVLSQVSQFTDKVGRWRNGRHIQEWVAASLMRIEPRLHKVNGWRHLKLLREKMQSVMHNRIQNGSDLVAIEA